MVAMRDERGFTLIELMIAMLVTMAVLGSAASVMTAVQSTYAYQMDVATVEQEARFTMDWIRRTVEQAGSNPYNISVSACPAANTAFQGIQMDPNANGTPDDIRVHADVGTPDGLLVGSTGTCTQANEDVTIALDAANKTITRYDRGADMSPVAWTDAVFTGLTFEYLDSTMAVTATPAQVKVVRVTLTGQARTPRPGMKTGDTFRLSSDIRLKSQ